MTLIMQLFLLVHLFVTIKTHAADSSIADSSIHRTRILTVIAELFFYIISLGRLQYFENVI